MDSSLSDGERLLSLLEQALEKVNEVAKCFRNVSRPCRRGVLRQVSFTKPARGS